MAQNERKARYILAPDVEWDQFVGGVQERLQLGAISRIEVRPNPHPNPEPLTPNPAPNPNS